MGLRPVAPSKRESGWRFPAAYAIYRPRRALRARNAPLPSTGRVHHCVCVHQFTKLSRAESESGRGRRIKSENKEEARILTHTHKQTNTQTNKQTNKRTNIHTETHTHTQTYRQR